MPSSTLRASSARGFTLIELMVTVAIVAILAAVAYPSYRDSVDRSRRSDAKAVLLENAQWLERQYTISNAYNKLGDSGGTTIDDTQLPIKEAPKSGSKTYDIKFKTGEPTGTTFVLEAIPKGSMSDDKCGTLTLSQTGDRNISGQATGVTKEQCWDR